MTSSDEEYPVHPRFGPLIRTRLRVLTWNLWGRGGPWEARLEVIAATLRAVQPDVALLQEVWEEGAHNQAAVLAAGLGFHSVFAGRPTSAGVTIGNAVVSRWPVVEHETRPLPAPPELEELRNVVRARLAGPRGPLDVYCTHLNWKFDQSDVRQDQVRTLARCVAETATGGFPPILAGDFNAVPEADEIRMVTGRTVVPVAGLVFHDAWEVAGDGGAGVTWTNANPWARLDLEPDRRIDYVFVGVPRRGGAGHVVACRLVGQPVHGQHPSDHFGVLAELGTDVERFVALRDVARTEHPMRAVHTAGIVLAALAVACGSGSEETPMPAAAARVTGTVTYRQRMALTPDAVVEVELRDVSLADAPAKRLGGHEIPTGGRQVPIPFEIAYDPAAIDPRHSYAVAARIRAGGKQLFVSDTSNAVLTRGAPATGVDIVVVPAASPTAPAGR